MTIAWVVGGGGLLGSALRHSLRRNGSVLFSPTERFSWGNESTLMLQIEAAVQQFAMQAIAAEKWEIYWAAGVGTMSSAKADLQPETKVLAAFLQIVGSHPGLMATHGAIVFASSAGSIYAGAADNVITEDTQPVPTTAYAYEKLQQEAVIKSFASANSTVTALIARISTLYGPGQAIGKQQGLITHIARSLLRHKPVQIFVPYDTIRDYIFADDAAAAMVTTLKAMSNRAGALIKIIASGQPTTIAEIIATFKKVTLRPPMIVTSACKLSSMYSRRVQFKSIAVPTCAPNPKTSLLVGIAQIVAAERVAYARALRVANV